jgi:hypothetical protein
MVYKTNVEKQMQEAGMDHESALQAASLAAQAEEKRLDRDLTDKLQAAEMLYKNDALQQSMNIQKDELEQRKVEAKNQVDQFTKTYGLNQLQVQSALSSEEANRVFGTIAALQSMPGYEDSPDLIMKTNEMTTDLLVKQGVITENEAKTGKLNARLGTFTTAGAFQDWAKGNGYSNNQINGALEANGINPRAAGFRELNPQDKMGGSEKDGVVKFETTKQGDSIAKLGNKTITEWGKTEWDSVLKSPEQVKTLIEEGAVKDLGKASSILRQSDFKKFLSESGVPTTNYKVNGNSINLVKPVPMTINGEVYMVDEYHSDVYGFDEVRVSEIYGYPAGGNVKERKVIKKQEKDI